MESGNVIIEEQHFSRRDFFFLVSANNDKRKPTAQGTHTMRKQRGFFFNPFERAELLEGVARAQMLSPTPTQPISQLADQEAISHRKVG